MILPDILDFKLKIVFCGTAVSKASANRNVYYANERNKFYSTLFNCGFTPYQLKPEEYSRLLEFRLGLSDLVKQVAGGDKYLCEKDFDVSGFKTKMNKYKPEIICFNGKRAAKEFLGEGRSEYLPYGLLEQNFNGIKLYVAPSTAFKADDYWDISHWYNLFDLIK
jgi:TDG/mug DNA glycosylase family protein